MQKFLDLAENQTKQVKTVQRPLSLPPMDIEKEISYAIEAPDNLEQVEYSMDLAFTLTINPKYRCLTYPEQYKLSHHIICTQLEECKFTMVAELHKDYNVHYHGILKVPKSKGDPLEWFFDRWRRIDIIGQKKDCEQVMNYNHWTTYIMKDRKRELKIPHCSKDDYGLLADLSSEELCSEPQAKDSDADSGRAAPAIALASKSKSKYKVPKKWNNY